MDGFQESLVMAEASRGLRHDCDLSRGCQVRASDSCEVGTAVTAMAMPFLVDNAKVGVASIQFSQETSPGRTVALQ